MPMSVRKFRNPLAAILLITGSLFCPPIPAQSSRSTITGRVTDSSGGSIPGATVTAKNAETGVGYTATTNATGNYSIQQLPEGAYKLTVEGNGFSTAVQDNVQLTLAQTLTFNATMQVGQVNESVEVNGTALAVQSNSSEVATSVTRQLVMDLPLSVSGNTRNIESFLFLTPGVTGTTANTQINGSQSRSKEVLIDGASSISPESGGTLFSTPSVEAISEFQLLGADFNAEYGRTGGGFEIFTTRSGTNDFHGSVFDYLRNDVFDARGFFALATPVNRQNEYGVVFGGPVWIPKVYKGRNKTFFHFVYSGFRYRQGASNSVISVAPAAFRAGDFSSLVNSSGQKVAIYDPDSTALMDGVTTRTAFPNNQIPVSRFSAVSQSILPLLPQTSNLNLLNNYLATGATKVDKDQIDIKIDHNFSDRHRVNGFFYRGEYPTTNPDILPQPLGQGWVSTYHSYWARFADDYIVSPSKVNHIGLGYTREGQYWYAEASNQDWPQKIGLAGVNTGPGNSFPQVSFSDGYYSFGAVNGAKTTGDQINTTYQLNDTFSWVAGKHNLKFGADARWLETNGADLFNSQGTFGFNSLETALPSASSTTGNSFASFLLGDVHSASRNVLGYVPGNRYRYLAGFVQDDWKITRHLTLNFGLRYDLYFPRSESHSNLSGFDAALPNPGAGGIPGAIAFLGSGPGRSGKSSFADTDYKNFGPRVAVAYTINDKTVVHLGYGIYYGPGNATTGLRQSQSYNYGFSSVPAYSSTNNGITPAFNWSSGFPTGYPLPPTISPTVANGSNVVTMYPGDGRPPYFQDWTVDLQRELSAGVLVNATYVGIKGTRLGTNLINLNQLNPSYLALGSLLTASVTSAQAVAAGIAVPYPGFTGSVAQALRPYPQYLNITDLANPNGNSTYNALQLKAQKRLSRGLTALVAYSWSKSLTDGENQAGGGPSGQDYYNRRLEKAVSQDDVPQNLAISYTYELPFGHDKHFLSSVKLVDRIAGGWTFTGIQQYSVGTPIVVSANNTLPIFNSGLRPNLVKGAPLTNNTSNFDPNTMRYINVAAFVVPPPYTFGTAARSYTNLRNPGYLNESFGMIKHTPLGEHTNLTFRAEFFNVFNRVQLGGPAANVSASNFGIISSQANAPRQGQMALRLDF